MIVCLRGFFSRNYHLLLFLSNCVFFFLKTHLTWSYSLNHFWWYSSVLLSMFMLLCNHISRTWSSCKTVHIKPLPIPNSSPWQVSFHFLNESDSSKVPHVHGITPCLSFYDWFLSLSILPSRFVYVVIPCWFIFCLSSTFSKTSTMDIPHLKTNNKIYITVRGILQRAS